MDDPSLKKCGFTGRRTGTGVCICLWVLWLWALAPFAGSSQTVLLPGDAAFIGIAANVGDDDPATGCETGTGSDRDRISLVFYKDIETGTVIDLTDNGWERRNAGQWGNSEGFLRMTRTGPAIRAGVTVRFELPVSNSVPPVAIAPDNGWQFQATGVVNFNSGGGDQLYVLQGGAWNNGSGCPVACQHDATYTGGRVICAFTNTGWLTTPPGAVNLSQRSRLHPDVSSCFAPSVPGDFVSYKMPQSATTQPVWTARVRNAANWTSFADCSAYVRPPDSFIVLNTVARLDCIGNCRGCTPLTSAFRLNLLVPPSWGPFSVTYTDGTNNRIINNAFDGLGFALVSTQSTRYSIVSVTAANGCPVPFTYGGNGSVVTEARPVVTDKDTLVCAGSKIDLLSFVTPAPDRSYSFHTSANPNAGNVLANPSVTINAPVTYYGQVLNTIGCRDTFALRFAIQPKGVAGIPHDTLLCVPEAGAVPFSLYETLKGATQGGIWTARPGDGLDAGAAFDPRRGTLDIGVLREGVYAFTYTAACDPLSKAQMKVYVRKVPLLAGRVRLADCAGHIALSPPVGTPPFRYDWNDLPGVSDPSDRAGLVPGLYRLTLADSSGCANRYSFTVPPLLKDTLFLERTTCDSLATPTTTQVFKNHTGCDSVVITRTHSLFVPPVYLFAFTCDRTAAGSNTRRLQAANGCDSLVVTTTVLLPSDTTFLQATSCDPTQTGITRQLLKNRYGCDSLIITTTTRPRPDTTRVQATSCDPRQTGIRGILLQNWRGCDSAVITTTRLLRSDTTFLSAASCDIKQTGETRRVLKNRYGCDSLVITNTTLLRSDTTFLSAASCDIKQTGETRRLLKNRYGCDSLIITNTTLLPSDTTFLSAASCDPQQTGETRRLLKNRYGCDSLVITNTRLLPSDTTFLSAASCDIKQTGETRRLLKNRYGCDSLIITNTRLLPSDTTFLSAASCDRQQTGETRRLLKNRYGCDSLIITNTRLLPSDTTFLRATSCDIKQVGEARRLLKNRYGCDSLLITHTTLLRSDSLVVYATTCDPVTIGTRKMRFLNAQGCDSVVTTITTLRPPDTTRVRSFVCETALQGTFTDVFTSVAGCDSIVITRRVYAPPVATFWEEKVCRKDSSGVFSKKRVGWRGCDSTVVVRRMYEPPDTTFLQAITCDPLQSGIQVRGLISTTGCDSIVITMVDLLPTPSVYVEQSSCDPQAAGVRVLELTKPDGCDSLVIITTRYIPPDTTYLRDSSCISERTGRFVKTLKNRRGCDSLLIKDVRLLPLPEQTLRPKLCTGEYILVNGQRYDLHRRTGTEVLRGASIGGCDSVVHVELQYSFLDLRLSFKGPVCHGGADGAIFIDSLLNGKRPYLFQIDQEEPLSIQAPFTRPGLKAGWHRIYIEDADLCAYEDTIYLAEPPLRRIGLPLTIAMRLGDSLRLEPQFNFSPQKIEWSRDSVLSCTRCPQPIVRPLYSFPLAVQAADSASCVVRATTRITVDKPDDVYVADVFMPEESEKNGLLLLSTGPSVAKIRQFSIFDRWGTLVYHAAQAAPGDATTVWDGRLAGRPLPTSVYVWKAEVEYIDGRVKYLTGNVTLLR
jgi:gliding motility-associated-like protein